MRLNATRKRREMTISRTTPTNSSKQAIFPSPGQSQSLLIPRFIPHPNKVVQVLRRSRARGIVDEIIAALGGKNL